MNSRNVLYFGLTAFVIIFFLIVWYSLSAGDKAIQKVKKLEQPVMNVDK